MRRAGLLGAAVLVWVLGQAAPAPAADLSDPIAEYRGYVAEQATRLVADTAVFVAAVKAGDLDAAKALYAPTRMSYERIEPVAELFGELDAAIDSRADDYEGAEQDPAFPGFHRIEYGLWVERSTAGLAPVADRLLADVQALEAGIAALDFEPAIVAAGAAELMEEIALSKISGEENRYSHTDLWDFRANVDGSRTIFALVAPALGPEEADFIATVEANFARLDAIVESYAEGDGYQAYDRLTERDRVALAAAVNTLAEELATLNARLDLD